MFGVDFNEMVVIAVVALIVIGPERLPRVARTAGHLLGRLQRYVHDVKSDIDKEMRLEELKKLQADMVQNVKGLETTVSAELNAVETSLNESIAANVEAKADAEAATATPNPGTQASLDLSSALDTPPAASSLAVASAEPAANPADTPTQPAAPAEPGKAA